MFFFFVYFQCSAQSEFNFDELLDIETASSSNFETIALNKGYQYDSTSDSYFCFISNQQLLQLTKRFVSGDFYGLIYSTYSKENYLKIKNRMIEMNFAFSKNVPMNKTEGLLFISNNIYITLYTETTNLIPRYNIAVQLNLLDVK